MNLGVSTANLYPMLLEESLLQLLKLGIRKIEVFVNTEMEVDPSFAREMRRAADAYGAKIIALHPYTSGVEPYLLFTAYQRRFEDGMKHYERIYEAASIMGASFVIQHGDRVGGVLPEETVISRYEKLYDVGIAQGITLLQENVVNFRSSDTQYLRLMRKLLGPKAKFVFDNKQCARCGLHPKDVITAMGEGIMHVHISDRNEKQDCLIPGKGKVDYLSLRQYLNSVGFKGTWILELYRSNFDEITELMEGYHYLETFINT